MNNNYIILKQINRFNPQNSNTHNIYILLCLEIGKLVQCYDLVKWTLITSHTTSVIKLNIQFTY